MYTCIQSYRSIVGAKRYYNEDEEISDLDYEILPEHEQDHWQPSSVSNSAVSSAINTMLNAMEQSMHDDDIEIESTRLIPDETPEQSNDFGGGDFGGGGASGEF